MEAILKDFPETIETERLYIRPCQPGDGRDVYEAVNHSREELKQWLPFAHTVMSKEDTEINIRKSYANFINREDIRLHIYRRSDNKFIGSTGLHRIKWKVPKFEIGYWVDTRYTKNGYITEAVEALTKFAFEYYGAKRVEIRCDPDNTGSRSIPERLGFTLEGLLRNDSVSADGNEVRSTCIFAKYGE
jgi:RimJ/RimL family protein N-acetyltransferase